MNRRLFSKLLAAGSGSLAFWQQAETADAGVQAAAAQPAAAPAAVPTPDAPPRVNVADFQALAEQTLPRATYEYITTGSTDEVTLRENVAAFQRIRVLPPLLSGVGQADPSTTVLGVPIALPVMLAPVAGQVLFHQQGAPAAARAAAAANTVYGVSSSVGHSLEEVAAAAPGPKWFQLYVPKDRAVARRTVERVERAGYKALIVTVDLGERKDSDLRNRFAFPPDILRTHLRNNGFDLPDRLTYEELLAFNSQAWDLALSWKFFDWLRTITRLPLLIKGVLRAEDAKQAVALGLDGIVVSNHGGRRLDGMPASIDQLAEVVHAVDGRAEVFLDSGVRRGTDVLKALALGARAVLIGRPYAWALAAEGEAGVRRILELFHEEFVTALLAAGCPSVGDIKPSLLVK
jgi:isopentenyl diphosphate isomerase/L-lactate dehydrogenase-like FMN-dependent dehydrogenase